MDKYIYQTVNPDDIGFGIQKSSGNQWKYFFRQISIASATWTLYFVAGLCIGLPTVLIPQMKREGTPVDDEVASWIYSVFGVSSLPWVIIVPVFSSNVGRKIPYFIAASSMLVVFIVLYFSVTPYHVIIAEVLQGYCHAANITMALLIVIEYSSPKYRGVFLTIKSASFFWGIWVANAIGTFFHWRYIAVAGIVCSVFTFIGAFHPESPHWLASKGRYEKCKESFRWLRGTDEASEIELRSIIDVQVRHRKQLLESEYQKDSLKTTFTSKQFYKPLMLSLAMGCQYHFSGKMVCSTYAVEVLKRMTRDEAAAYSGMLILDGVTVFGMYIGSFLSKILKRRTLYLTSSFIGVIFLLLLAGYLYLAKLELVHENNNISISLLTVYSVCISCGPVIMSMTITGEIIPIRYQTLCFSIYASTFSIIFTILMKFAPDLFKGLGMHGSFFFYGLTAGIFTVILYLYLPETKDKTILEIEKYFEDKEVKETVDELSE